MDAVVATYLHHLVQRCEAQIGADLVGVYAAGSVAMDAYRPGRSDIDVAVVTRHRLGCGVKRELVQRLVHEVLPCPARGLELVVYRHDVARSGTADPGFELELNTGAQMQRRVTLDPSHRPAADGLFWYALDRAVLAARGRALVGPPVAQVFRAPTDTQTRRLLGDAVSWWAGQPASAAAAADVVLSAARALAWHAERQWLAKDEAVRRLLAIGVQPQPVLLAALEGDPGPDAAQARAFSQQVLAILRQDANTGRLR